MKIEPATALRGHIGVPGDKSISHRALLFGAIGDGRDGDSRLRPLGGHRGDGRRRVRALGVTVHDDDVDTRPGRGRRACGACASRRRRSTAATPGRRCACSPGCSPARSGRFELTGDDSLRRRPVDRIAAPLAEMGARVETRRRHARRSSIEGGALRGIRYELPVASAQVKSCILLAGLYAEGRTTVVEPLPTRDHTELMLAAAGARVTAAGSRASRSARSRACASARSTSRATSPPPRRSWSRRRCCPGRS